MRMKNKLISLFFLMCVYSATAVAQLRDEAIDKVSELISKLAPQAAIGVMIQNVDNGQVLYETRAKEWFTPASTTKLFTAAAALYYLGPEYRYQTTLYYNKSEISGDKLNGDVAIVFQGDPSFNSDNLTTMVGRLQQLGIREISGDFYIDDSFFEGPMLGRGWGIDSVPWYYSAPVSAIIIDQNQVGVTLKPSQTIGQETTASLTQLAHSQFFPIASNIKTVTFAESEKLCQIEVNMSKNNEITIGGCWPVGEDSVALKLAVSDPKKYVQEKIQEQLKKFDITFSGQIKFEASPSKLSKLVVHESKPLHELLVKVLAESNNIYSDSLTKVLGQKMYGKGSFHAGVLAIEQVLARPTGIDFSKLRLVDGSGISHYNLVTPEQLSRLLYTMVHDQVIGSYFREALALSGVNGTLKRRLASFDTKSHVRAKTGSMTGVSALSGYLETRNQKQLIVTIITNRALLSSSSLKQFEDEICYVLSGQA